MKRMAMPLPSSASSNHLSSHSMMPDLLWISKQQQQHPSTLAHPLRNTIRVSSNGIRHKFDGKQWRPLCESPDGFECRNLVFRSALCQKHFYKLHQFKRPCGKSGSISSSLPSMVPHSLKRSLPSSFEKQQHHHHHHHSKNDHHDIENEHENIYKDDDSIEVLENNDPMTTKPERSELKNHSQPGHHYFSIACDPQLASDTNDITHVKPEPLPQCKLLNAINNNSVLPNESENSSVNISLPKVAESVRLGLPPLTRTEEKSLAYELIAQLPADATVAIAEHMARRRACEIVLDNYSHQLSPINITPEWFYDFLLRNPRVPIHFQSWFSSVKSNFPPTDQLIDIKIWELGLVTRSIMSPSSVPASSSSP
ncbi:unnamed protein product [Rotaria socialis]|uniref:Uncharacterized protein n=1 Tax=Rotaria socialis TaxID=392032 RepID=A0A821C1G1_9BILA|nr:unnamed protein product [Rotaria socialis]CAF4600677.1 unnamed protein product [Rotaria socialis]